jgi:hypothetical protein
MVRWLFKLIQLPLALVLMFYEWGWQSLSAVFEWLAKRPIWGWLEAQIRRAPPWLALILFLLPSATLFPLKILALWLVAHGQKMAGVALIFAAKIVGTALIARLFVLTQPALMQIAWFARFFNWFKPWKDAWIAALRASWPWRYARVMNAQIRRQMRRWRTRWGMR